METILLVLKKYTPLSLVATGEYISLDPGTLLWGSSKLLPKLVVENRKNLVKSSLIIVRESLLIQIIDEEVDLYPLGQMFKQLLLYSHNPGLH